MNDAANPQMKMKSFLLKLVKIHWKVNAESNLRQFD